MRFRDLMTLRTPVQVADDAHATEARILAPLDDLVIEAREVVEHYRAAVPYAFDDRRDRRAGDRHTQEHSRHGFAWVAGEEGGYWASDAESMGEVFRTIIDDAISASMPPRLPPFDLTHKRGAGCGGAL